MKWSYLSQEIVWLYFTSLVAQMVKASAYHAGDLGSIPGSGRSFGEGNGNPLQYSLPGKSMDVGAWWATVHGVAKSPTWLTNPHFFILPYFWKEWISSLFFLIYHKAILEGNYYDVSIGYSLMVGLFPFSYRCFLSTCLESILLW